MILLSSRHWRGLISVPSEVVVWLAVGNTDMLRGALSRLGFWRQGKLHRRAANQALATHATNRFPAMVTMPSERMGDNL